MKSLATALSLAGLLGLAACNQAANGQGATSPRTFDTGNMAYPTPQPAGNLATTSTRGGGLSNGTFEPASTAPDTGNMALPRAAQGNSIPR